MSYKALYRTYRPSSFDDVVGQKHIVVTLQNAVKQNKIAHAYLFCGPRGTGKTSIAKLLAKAVNCEEPDNAPCGQCKNCISIQKGNHPDIVEIDAASNNGVDEIRDLIEKVKYSPIEGRYKVYIIDEVHMLSTGAFNALLKTLEEPPAHVIFVLATTEPHKVLPTIISRCQRYDFSKVENEEIIRRIHLVLKQENIECEEEAIRLIATLADGGMRDALSILDQCIAYAQNHITCAHVNEIYGITTISEKLEMLEYIFNQDARSILNKIKIWNDKGIDIRRLTSDLIEIIKEAVIYGYTKDETLLVKLNTDEAVHVLSRANPKKMLEMIQLLMETTEKYRTASNVSSYFEVAVLKMIALIGELNEPIAAEIKNQDSQLKEPLAISQLEPSYQKQEKDELNNEEFIISKAEVQDEVDLTETEDIPAIIIEEPSAELIIQEVSAKRKHEPTTMSNEEILGLMVQGSKPEKMQDIEKWKSIEGKCRDLSCARYANTLKDSSVAVSGDAFILIATQYQALANEIQEMKNELEVFLQQELNIHKVLFVTTMEHVKEVTQEFIERRRDNLLPPPLTIEKKVVKEEVKEEVKDKTVAQMISLFGDEFEIIEEEEK